MVSAAAVLIILKEWPTLVSVVVVFLVVKYWWSRPKLPPGPTLVPLLGIIPGFVSNLDPFLMKKFSDDYKSDIISVRCLGKLMVILNSRELIKDTFMIRKDVMDRCGLGWRLLDPHHRGIVMANSGPLWSATNRLMRRLVRDYGYDRSGSPSEALIMEETEKVRDLIIAYDGEEFDPDYAVNGAQCNIMMQLLFNKTIPYGDQEMKDSMDSLLAVEEAIWKPSDEFFLGTKLGRTIWKDHHQRIINHYKTYVGITHREVESHVTNFNRQVNDLCDGFISEMQQENQNSEDIDVAQLKNIFTDLVEASIESNRVQLRWFLLTMAAYPDIQETCYQEIIGAFGKDHVINFDDKSRTPYLLATMYEILRHHIELPFGLYQCNKDRQVKIGGYDVPRGTPVAANYTWLNNDPSTWKNPSTFDPNNFLEDGKLINQDKLASFSIGRRSCRGEPLAKVQFYIFFANWIKDFEIKFADGVKPDLESLPDPPCNCKPYKIKMIYRK